MPKKIALEPVSFSDAREKIIDCAHSNVPSSRKLSSIDVEAVLDAAHVFELVDALKDCVELLRLPSGSIRMSPAEFEKARLQALLKVVSWLSIVEGRE